MEVGGEESSSRKRRRISSDDTGPYVLRTLIEHVPLVADDVDEQVDITCVELWDSNLYIGTSRAEILHFVLIPPDDATSTPAPILASRLQPPSAASSAPPAHQPGIQQILLLPRVNKACILCNGMLTFYSLPELSPAFGTTKVRNCSWVGGVDLDLENGDSGQPRSGEHMMISFKDRIQLVRVEDSEKPRSIKNIDYAASVLFARRGSIACVATAHSYALLDVDHQQKIPLFSISSLDEVSSGPTGGQVEDISPRTEPGLSRHASAATPRPGPTGSDVGHGRSTSLGALVGALGRRQQSPRPHGQGALSTDGPEDGFSDAAAPESSSQRLAPGQVKSSSGSTSPEKPLPAPPKEEIQTSPERSSKANPTQASLLPPHILSPRSNEFLLTTGTARSEAGVGMFVNSDGDVFRSTLQFDHYPDALVLDGRGVDSHSQHPDDEDANEGYVLAVMEGASQTRGRRGLEIQRWDVDAGDNGIQKAWLDLPDAEHQLDQASASAKLGISKVLSSNEMPFPEVSKTLGLARLRLPGDTSSESTPASVDGSDPRTRASLEQVSKEMELFESRASVDDADKHNPDEEPPAKGWESKRKKEEEQFASSFGLLRSRIVIWSGNRVWWAIRNPLAIRLDAALALAMQTATDLTFPLDRRKIVTVLNSIRGQEAKTEAEYLSLAYIRQKASLLLFLDLMYAIMDDQPVTLEDQRWTEEALIDGGLDPRVILATFPPFREEVVEGRMGIWLHGGIKATAETFLALDRRQGDLGESMDVPVHLLLLLQRYFTAWRRKKGFGSVADEHEVSQTVDAALLRILLQLDSPTISETLQSPSSVRAELHALVDQGVDCLDRAVTLLEASHRLYVLSRLYHSQRMAAKVLATWKRILEGARDDGGEFADGEHEIRRYLTKLRDPALVEEYGTWLAGRNAHLGVQVFADEKSRVRFEPVRVIQLLKDRAPDAVKEYLEYLVFAKRDSQYANELISFYLDTVLSVLQDSEAARATLARSYESYRALRPPRPTYRHFIGENAVEEDWWHSRLRLLQLLGGGHGAASEYDVPAVLSRIEPFEKELVAEMIILGGRQGLHSQALRLLIHGLGDYDTAINYCLLGGSSIYHPRSGPIPRENLPSREEQAVLFGHVLSESLRIEDGTDRLEQTCNLLERFGRWYDIRQVLDVIPESWSVEAIAPFLTSSLRRMVHERNETSVAKALSGAENLMLRVNFVDECEKLGPAMEAADSGVVLS